MYITNTVVFLTAYSIPVSLLSSKTHNGDDTAKDQIIRYRTATVCAGAITFCLEKKLGEFIVH